MKTLFAAIFFPPLSDWVKNQIESPYRCVELKLSYKSLFDIESVFSRVQKNGFSWLRSIRVDRTILRPFGAKRKHYCFFFTHSTFYPYCRISTWTIIDSNPTFLLSFVFDQAWKRFAWTVIRCYSSSRIFKSKTTTPVFVMFLPRFR